MEAVQRAEKGLIDTDLGGGVIKQRIGRQGAGKSSDYRSVVIYRRGEKAFFVFGYAKSAQGTIQDDEEAQFKKAAKQPAFARYLNVSKNLVSGWERGVKKPGGPALRLLTVIQKKGLQVIA